MAAASSSSQEKYDVFLSFRGEDTRDGFTGYLYHALCEKHILTYMDDEKLESGHEISSELMDAISESKICIIVFSKNFASSTWCLDEMVRILECKRNGNNVIPIFYGIEPSIVRKQEESYAEAFAKHEQYFKERMDKVQQWRDALKQVAALSGYDSKNFRPEYKFIEKIVEDILLKLSKYRSTNDHFERHLIGIEKPMKVIEQLLCIGSTGVRIIGLYGMGGIGKTTLARAVFQNFYRYFESYCFLNDVREEFERHGINHLREKLLFELFKDKNLLNMESTLIQDRCRRTRVLIVLDDLDAIFQLNKLLPKVYEFGVGSRIIVTTRDAQVLKSRTDKLYEVKKLNDFEALKLFRLHAFGQISDLPGYETLSKSVADYAQGNPLALEVLGSSLYSKSIKEWQSALDKLKINLDKDIQKVLKISYDGLGDNGIQNIFLDFACFFEGEVNREHIESILHGSEHSDAIMGISVLIDKCLLIECQKRLSMHALLRQMGKAIVCDENKEPGNRSRLWKAKDVCHVLERNTGSSEIEGILLNRFELKKDVKVRSTAFSKMCNLRFLRMHCDYRFDLGGILYEKVGWAPYKKELCKNIYIPPEGLESFGSDELRYFQWDSYHFKDLPSDFKVENLVVLVMRESQLVELHWNEDQLPVKLKKMDLSYSENLIRIPNLSRAVNLESINLRGCTSLVQVPSSFKNLDKLQFLDLSECDYLKDGIENLPLNIKELRLCGTAIEIVPSSIGYLLGLTDLDLSDCKRLKSLPENIWKLKYLKSLYLYDCRNLEKLPLISDCISSSLRYLDISGCSRLITLTQLPSCLSTLYANDCTSLETILSWSTPTAQDLGEECCDYDYDPDESKCETYVFDDCLKLDHNTCNNVIANRARCRILSSQDDISSLNTVYPGDQIPEWFTHQTDHGNSIHIQLPPNWFNINHTHFKFVFCAVFTLNNSEPETNIKLELEFKTNINSDDHPYNYNDGWLLFGNTNPYHILIRYQTIDLEKVFGANWFYICSNVSEAYFCVFIEGEEVNWMIKKCGLELVNKWGATKSKRRFDECCGQPNGYQDKDESYHPHINSKRIK